MHLCKVKIKGQHFFLLHNAEKTILFVDYTLMIKMLDF
jgi:hypothetical protein